MGIKFIFYQNKKSIKSKGEKKSQKGFLFYQSNKKVFYNAFNTKKMLGRWLELKEWPNYNLQ